MSMGQANGKQIALGTSGFVNNLTSADSDAQKLAATIDGMKFQQKTYNGLDNGSLWTVTHVPATRVVTVAVGSATSYRIGGQVYSQASGSFPLPAHANTSGVWYVLATSSGLQVSSTFDFLTQTIVAYVYFNATAVKSVVFDERHPADPGWPPSIHRHDHQTIGALLVSGGTLSGITLTSPLTASMQYSIDQTVFDDESLRHTLAALTGGAGVYTTWYRSGASAAGEWDWTTGLNLSFLNDGDDPYWNELTGGNWQQTLITTNSRWVNYWIVATNGWGGGGHRFIAIQGQQLHTTLASAQAASFLTAINWGTLPFAEIVPLARITLRRVSDPVNLNFYVDDWVSIRGTRTALISTTAPSVHNTLSGRSDPGTHPYTSLTGKPVITVTTEAELEAAVIELNIAGGGQIIVKGSISITSNKIWDLSGIRLTGPGAGISQLVFTGTPTPNTITVYGSSLVAENIWFVGSKTDLSTPSTDSQTLILAAEGTTGQTNRAFTFRNCEFHDCVGSVNTTPVINLNGLNSGAYDKYVTVNLFSCAVLTTGQAASTPTAGMKVSFGTGGANGIQTAACFLQGAKQSRFGGQVRFQFNGTGLTSLNVTQDGSYQITDVTDIIGGEIWSSLQMRIPHYLDESGSPYTLNRGDFGHIGIFTNTGASAQIDLPALGDLDPNDSGGSFQIVRRGTQDVVIGVPAGITLYSNAITYTGSTTITLNQPQDVAVLDYVGSNSWVMRRAIANFTRIASTIAGLDQAITDLNSLGGGTILVTGTIMLDSDKSWDLSNIIIRSEPVGHFFGLPPIRIDTNGYRITLTGETCHFDDVVFNGTLTDVHTLVGTSGHAVASFTAPSTITLATGVGDVASHYNSPGTPIRMVGATTPSNNGPFTIVSAAWNGTNTVITVSEATIASEAGGAAIAASGSQTLFLAAQGTSGEGSRVYQFVRCQFHNLVGGIVDGHVMNFDGLNTGTDYDKNVTIRFQSCNQHTEDQYPGEALYGMSVFMGTTDGTVGNYKIRASYMFVFGCQEGSWAGRSNWNFRKADANTNAWLWRDETVQVRDLTNTEQVSVEGYKAMFPRSGTQSLGADWSGAIVNMNSASAMIFRIGPYTEHSMRNGGYVDILKTGAGSLTFRVPDYVTLYYAGSSYTGPLVLPNYVDLPAISSSYELMRLQCVGDNTWVLIRSQEATRIRETTGPTSLAIGAVADGSILVRSGTSVIGATSASLSVAQIEVTQATHGFTAPTTAVTIIRHNGTSWVRAQADSAANAEGCWVVTSVPTADTFVCQKVGKVDITGWGLSAGTVYFLSPTVAGGITTAKTSTLGQVQLPIIQAHTTTSGEIYHLIGTVVSGSTLPTHATTHENGGSDEINVAGLSGVLADPQTPAAHESTHVSGGSDAFLSTDILEAIVQRIRTTSGPTNLTVGSIPDGQVLVRSGTSIIGLDTTPSVYSVAAITDNVLVKGDGGGRGVQATGITVADTTNNISGAGSFNGVTVEGHATRHENGGADEISVAGLSGVLADAQTPAAHAATHSADAADEITVENLGTAGAIGTVPISDGDGTMTMGAPAPAAHASTHSDGGSDEITVEDLATSGATGEVPVAQSDGSLLMTDLNDVIGGVQARQLYHYLADMFLITNTTDWAGDGTPAAIIDDPSNAAIPVAAFADDDDEGVGMEVYVPSGATDIIFILEHRAQTAPSGSDLYVDCQMHFRAIPDNGALPSWTTVNMAELTIPDGVDEYLYTVRRFSLSTIGMTAGQAFQIKWTRYIGGTDTLIDDWYLRSIRVYVDFAGIKWFPADTMQSALNADWSVNANAPIATDDNNSALKIRRHNDSTEEGCGIGVFVPEGIAKLGLHIISRAQTPPTVTPTAVEVTLHYRQQPNNGAFDSWRQADMASTVTIPITNPYFQYNFWEIDLASLGTPIVPGNAYLLEITRNAGVAGDTLVDDWYTWLYGIEFY